MKPHHPQVPFTTIDGQHVNVDEGLFDILTRLKALGVRTQYSCQGGQEKSYYEVNPAYVVADAKSFRPVIRAMRKLHHSTSVSFLDYLFEHPTKWRLDIAYGRPDLPTYIHFGFRLKNNDAPWSVERNLSSRYGNRTTLRWPDYTSDLFLDVLHKIDI